MLNPPNLTNLNWLTDFIFHGVLLSTAYLLAGKEKIILVYLVALLVLSFVLSYWLKKEQSENTN